MLAVKTRSEKKEGCRERDMKVKKQFDPRKK